MESVETVVITAIFLPVQVSRNESGGWNIEINKATTISTLFQLRKQYPVRVMFVGWPGIHIQDYVQQQEVRHLLLDMDCIPVFPSADDFNLYLEFCTSFLWPAYNNVVRAFQGDNPVPFNQEQWAAYQYINQRYAETVVSNVREHSDVIWVHDYHLLLTPMHITRKLRKANIGFFLHSPFPSSEIFRCLPVRDELLKGMLCSDLIGFHFWEYARHFLTCCRRILGCEFEFKRDGFIGIDYCSREVRVRVGHACLQFDYTMSRIRDPRVLAKSELLRQMYAKRFIFLGIDRCDRLSGLKLKLLAYKKFLERYPEMVSKVVLLQYVYLSALQSEPERKKITTDLEQTAELIKTQFGAKCLDLLIGELDHTVKFAALRIADVLVDTSLKDGLNLIPFEYCAGRLSLDSAASEGGSETNSSVYHSIASELSSMAATHGSHTRLTKRGGSMSPGEETGENPYGLSSTENPYHYGAFETGISELAQQPVGVMIISEFTGCSRVLVGAIKVNPWNTDRVVDSFLHAVNMTLSDRKRHFIPDANYVSSHSLIQWTSDFIRDIRECRKKDEMVYVAFGFGAHTRLMGIDQHFGKLDIYDVVQAYKRASLRLLLLDNEGTLASNTAFGNQLRDNGNPPSENVLSILRTLTKDPSNLVVITSGRPRALLESWFGSVAHIGYAAEHGFTYKVPAIWGEDCWRNMLPPGCESMIDMTWISLAYQLMELYQKRVQNTYIYFKGSAMVWQYREADPELGSWQARELSAALEETLSSYHVVVSSGKGYVEVKVKGVNKGAVAKSILEGIEKKYGTLPDFVLCIGDDRSDELTFEAVNEVMKPTEEDEANVVTLASAAGVSFTPELARARSGMSFADLSMCTPGADFRKLQVSASMACFGGSLKRSPSKAAASAAFADDALGAMESVRGTRATGASSSSRGASTGGGHASHMHSVFTCTVGKKPSKARYYLDDVDEVSEVLGRLVMDRPEQSSFF